MSKTVEDIENRVDKLLDSAEPLSHREIYELYRLSIQLGQYSVYNENGWDYEFE